MKPEELDEAAAKMVEGKVRRAQVERGVAVETSPAGVVTHRLDSKVDNGHGREVSRGRSVAELETSKTASVPETVPSVEDSVGTATNKVFRTAATGGVGLACAVTVVRATEGREDRGPHGRKGADHLLEQALLALTSGPLASLNHGQGKVVTAHLLRLPHRPRTQKPDQHECFRRPTSLMTVASTTLSDMERATDTTKPDRHTSRAPCCTILRVTTPCLRLDTAVTRRERL